ncbi:MAG TPA: carbohydrate ABC transporter permease [Amycolatopsis sp.]|nr:carbohydrate ABC transporter permease [Amycolatopsis sp.]
MSRRPSTRSLTLRYALLVIVFLISIGPFLWQLSTSLKGIGEDIYSYPPSLLPLQPTLHNYARVSEVVPVFHFALNSLIAASMSVVANCAGASMAGYALARLRFRGRKLAFLTIVAGLLVPLESILISQFLLVRSLGLNNTLIAVILPGAVGALNVLLMRNAFLGFPHEVEEAALIDGATAWQRFFRIGLPAVKGTIAVVALFAFVGVWDDFLWPLIVLSDPDRYTLTVGLDYLEGQFAQDQRLIAAGTIIAVAPLIVLFVFLQRFFFRGVGEGAVKG